MGKHCAKKMPASLAMPAKFRTFFPLYLPEQPAPRMKNTSIETAPQLYARIGGIAYLVIIGFGLFGEMFVRNAMIVPADVAATTHNIVTSQLLWRAGIAGDLVMHVCDGILVMVYYLLFRRVNQPLALLVVLLSVVQTAVLVSNKMNLMMPLFLAERANYLEAFTSQQLQALSYLSLKAHDYGFGVGLIFFGFECLILGYLIIKSGFMPAALGTMMQVAGVCYLVNSFALILHPALAISLFPFIMIPPFIAELSLCLWLIVKGINEEKWKSVAGT